MIRKNQLHTDYVEKLRVKDKQSLEENGLSPCDSDSTGFLVRIVAQNREVVVYQPVGEFIITGL